MLYISVCLLSAAACAQVCHHYLDRQHVVAECYDVYCPYLVTLVLGLDRLERDRLERDRLESRLGLCHVLYHVTVRDITLS